VAFWSGWIAAVAIVLAAIVPLGHRLRTGKRGAPGSPAIKLHVALGAVTALLALGHTFVVLPELGSSAAIAGGMVALAPGALAFFVLFAHAGLGLQLRSEKLRDRAKKRRAHLATATIISVAVVVHVIALHFAA
jgi:cytochrome b561